MLALLIRAVALAALGATAGLVFNALRPQGIALQAAPPPAVCKVAAVTPTVERLSPQQANRLCGDPTVLVADARSAESFAAGHVVGAVHLPCAASGDVAQAVPQLLSGRHTVVVYGNTTIDAVAVADGLQRRHAGGKLRVAVIEGGFTAWDEAGFACASGPCPECAEARHEHAPGEPQHD